MTSIMFPCGCLLCCKGSAIAEPRSDIYQPMTLRCDTCGCVFGGYKFTSDDRAELMLPSYCFAEGPKRDDAIRLATAILDVAGVARVEVAPGKATALMRGEVTDVDVTIGFAGPSSSGTT